MGICVLMIPETGEGELMVLQRELCLLMLEASKGSSLVGTMCTVSDGVFGEFSRCLVPASVIRSRLRQSRPFPDPLVKVYDLRTMRPLPPLPFSDGPSFISTLPKKDSSVVVVSNQGLINIVDVSNPSANEFYQASHV
jgi:hypothetical protein